MQIFFVRHGETDWKSLEARGIRGWARSFAPLTPIGRVQIDTIASDYRLQEADAILCSSYARALESAARLSRVLNKPLYVEYDLHEWLPHVDPLADDAEAIVKAQQEFMYYAGFTPELGQEPRGAARPTPTPTPRRPSGERTPPPPSERTWESLDEVRDRVIGALRRYANLSSVIVVSHAVVIASIVGAQRMIEHAEIVPFELDLDSPEKSFAKERQRYS